MKYLILVLCVTAIAAGAEAVLMRRRRTELRALARQWGMHFAMGDRLRLADRIAHTLPIPGSANVRVRDLLFCTDGASHQYVFTVEYGLGVVRGKRRRCRVGGFAEPVARGDCAQSCEIKLELAPEKLELAAAYAHVRSALLGAGAGGLEMNPKSDSPAEESVESKVHFV
jgi:hypothetical protein